MAESAVARRITYRGDAARAGLLVAMLEDEGVRIASETQYAPDADEAVVEVVAVGTAADISSGVERFRGRTWHAKVEIEGEPDGSGLVDDGGQQ